MSFELQLKTTHNGKIAEEFVHRSHDPKLISPSLQHSMGSAVGELANDIESKVPKPDREVYDSLVTWFVGESGGYLFQESFGRPVDKRLILDKSAQGKGIADGTSDFRMPFSIDAGKQVWDHNTLADTGSDCVHVRLHHPDEFSSQLQLAESLVTSVEYIEYRDPGTNIPSDILLHISL